MYIAKAVYGLTFAFLSLGPEYSYPSDSLSLVVKSANMVLALFCAAAILAASFCFFWLGFFAIVLAGFVGALLVPYII